jgi:putative phosphoribosyl transferase
MAAALYRDRQDAGRRLAARAERLRHEAPVVIAVPRGGVPVAVEVARVLAAPLDVLVTHKVGEPGRRLGAVAEGGLAVIDHDRVRELGVSAEQLAEWRERAGAAADAAASRFRTRAAPLDIVGRTVVIVDDGAGTGASAIAAARTARHRGGARIVLALPVANAAVLPRLGEELDEVICVAVEPLARWYESAPAMSDEEIAGALRDVGPVLGPRLHMPQAARGAIVVATAGELARRTFDGMGFATLQVPAGEAEELVAAAARLRSLPAAEHLRLGLFGFGTTAAAALAAACETDAGAVVAAGGRPDRAAERLTRLNSPTLLVVGGEDRSGLRQARDFSEQLAAPVRQVAVVAGATRDFVEPGALEQVVHLAGGWFARHLLS